MGHDEVGDMECLVPMKKELDRNTCPTFLKTTYCYRAILNL